MGGCRRPSPSGVPDWFPFPLYSGHVSLSSFCVVASLFPLGWLGCGSAWLCSIPGSAAIPKLARLWPGVSDASEQVTVSAINRNFQGRSGPGRLWLASPLTVAASAFEGRIAAFRKGMFATQTAGAGA